mmetsp:Transcript_72407/g.146858  ORF Transcript_72407/g.146858 Transcript_72407/m.146858 type:complete len:125 (-) Transcript_72407:34-408(-)
MGFGGEQPKKVPVVPICVAHHRCDRKQLIQSLRRVAVNAIGDFDRIAFAANVVVIFAIAAAAAVVCGCVCAIAGLHVPQRGHSVPTCLWFAGKFPWGGYIHHTFRSSKTKIRDSLLDTKAPNEV